ncbi:isopentenyl-diphosphate Delta-isomerase [Aeromicrobium sp.]|nr:isopentenyl-diphosphate Delta-isomerase [Candidatus Saccharibacteria bacterium]
MIEQIVFVNPDGTPTGEVGPKLASHTADTKLHLAFSCYVFNDKGEFLVTQRAHVKKVWPNVWTNSVCGHPGPGESTESAITRRIDYELGMIATDLQVVLPSYTYKTPPYNAIIEHEFCPVYVARASSEPVPNPAEVDDYKWLPWEEFVAITQADTSDVWSWWCKDQLKQLADQSLIQQYSRRV